MLGSDRLSSGAWLVLPSYMMYLIGDEIVQGLTIGGEEARSSLDGASLVKTE